MPTSVFTEGEKVLRTAAGSTGTGAWARRGLIATAHQEQREPARGYSSAFKQGTDEMREQKLIVVGVYPTTGCLPSWRQGDQLGRLVSCGQPV